MQENLSSEVTMQQIVSTITSKGQVTIPAAVRRHLGVGTKDKIAFIVEDTGEVKLTAAPYPTIASLRGAAGTLKEPLSWKEIQQIAHEDHAEEVHGKPGRASPSSIRTSSSAS